MKRFALLFQILFLFGVSIFSQNTESSRIAFVSYYAFEDEKIGIKKLVEALVLVYPHYHGRDPLFEFETLKQKKSKELENKDLTESQKTEIKKSIAEITEKFEATKKEISELYEKRKNILVQPLLDKIETQLNLIAEQNNLIILDLNELDENAQLLYLDEKTDVTKIIIPILNDFLSTNILLPTKFDIPQPKIALLNTEIFSDETKGINELVVYQKEVAKAMKAELRENPTKEQVDSWNKSEHKIKGSEVFGKIGNAIQTFAKTKEITLIIDSSKNVPAKLQKFPSDDVTNQFISYYNQMNK